MDLNEKLAAKKRMMFISSEDFYFLAYNTVIILDALGCTEENKQFVDHRKLPALIEFTSNGLLASALLRYDGGRVVNAEDSQFFADAYGRSTGKEAILYRLLLSLERRNVIGLVKSAYDEGVNVFLKPSAIPKAFLANDIYSSERENIRAVQRVLRQTRIMKLRTMLGRLFEDKGVLIWHV